MEEPVFKSNETDKKVSMFQTGCLCWHVLSPKAVNTEYFILKDSINTCSNVSIIGFLFANHLNKIIIIFQSYIKCGLKFLFCYGTISHAMR